MLPRDSRAYKTLQRSPWQPVASTFDTYLTAPFDVLRAHAGDDTRIEVEDRRVAAAHPLVSSVPLTVHQAPRSLFRAIATAGWELDVAFHYDARSVRFASLDLAGELMFADGFRISCWVPEHRVALDHGALENVLRIATAYRALLAGGLVVHSASVIDHGKAALFVGRSGAGKSTLSRRARGQGLVVPSDDLNILLPAKSGGFDLTRSSFGGDAGPDLSAPERTPLTLVAFLEKGPKDERRAVGPASAIARLLACCPFVGTDPHRADTLLTRCEAVLAATPCVEQWFEREGSWTQLTTPAGENGA